MRRNRIIYILFIIGCVVFSAVYKSRLSAVLLAAVIAYPFVAILLCLASLYCIKAGFGEHRGVYEKNTPFDILIDIRNRFIFAYAPVELVCMLPDRDTGIFSEKRIFASLAPFGGCRITVNCIHKYRGSYISKINRIAVYDPLRIIRISRAVKEEMQQVFLPRKIVLGDLIAMSENDRSASPSRLLSGEKDDFSHVREYAVGDIIQMVHWKLTAKQDELMIKQFDEITDRRAVVLCDYGFDSKETSLLLRADGIIETAIAFAMSAAEAGVRVTVDFGTLDRSFVCEIGDKGGFDRFYQLMAVLPARIDVGDFYELIDSVDKTGMSVIFLVTGRLTEELICRADYLAGSFSGVVVLAFVNLGGSPLEEYAQEKRFVFLNICGDSDDALSNAVENAELQ